MNIRPQDFEILTRMLARAAGVPLAMVLEGGYSPSHGKAIHHIFRSLISDGKDTVQGLPSERTQAMVSWLKSEHHLP
jgi:acetoin utilization deacetylase AcuC-like enzyme